MSFDFILINLLLVILYINNRVLKFSNTLFKLSIIKYILLFLSSLNNKNDIVISDDIIIIKLK